MPSSELTKSDVPGPSEPKMLDRTPRRRLTLSDRCDLCGAAAWASASITGVKDDGTIFTDVPLLFCAHHFTKFEAGLRVLTDEITDERAFLHAEVAGQKSWSEPDGATRRKSSRA